MNGVVYFRGTRYDVSTLDLAVLADIGVPLSLTTAGDSPVVSLADDAILTSVFTLDVAAGATILFANDIYAHYLDAAIADPNDTLTLDVARTAEWSKRAGKDWLFYTDEADSQSIFS